MLRRRLSVLVTPAITLGVALVAVTACSTSGTPTAASGGAGALPAPDKVLSTTKAAATSASAVHIKGAFAEQGDKVALDLQLNKSDGSAQGTITEGGTTIPLILTDKVYYVQFTPDLMKTSGIDPTSDVGKLLSNKWVPSNSKVLSGSDMVSGLQPLTDYNSFIPTLFDQLKGDTPKQSGTDNVNGSNAGVYTFSDGTTADVGASDPHYLLRLTEPASEGKGQLDFTGWNQPVAVSKPPAAQIYSGPGT